MDLTRFELDFFHYFCDKVFANQADTALWIVRKAGMRLPSAISVNWFTEIPANYLKLWGLIA